MRLTLKDGQMLFHKPTLSFTKLYTVGSKSAVVGGISRFWEDAITNTERYLVTLDELNDQFIDANIERDSVPRLVMGDPTPISRYWENCNPANTHFPTFHYRFKKL